MNFRPRGEELSPKTEDALLRAFRAAGVADSDHDAVTAAFVEARKRGLGDEEALSDAFDDAGVQVTDPAAGVKRFSERTKRYEESRGVVWRKRLRRAVIAVVLMVVIVVTVVVAVNLTADDSDPASIPESVTVVVDRPLDADGTEPDP